MQSRPLKYLKTLRYIFLLVDIGFVAYWAITAFSLIPEQYLYSDYTNPILTHWNWSFFPLDILISVTGLSSVYLHSKKSPAWKSVALISLVLTSVSGLQAVSYWTLAGESDLSWWIPNLFLLIYPLFYIPRFIRGS